MLIIGASASAIGMAFNPEYCVVVDNDDFKNGAKIQLFPDTQRFNDGKHAGKWWTHMDGKIPTMKTPSFSCFSCVLDGWWKPCFTLSAGI